MKMVVVYQSKYGSTRQYAQWIAQDLQADCISVSDCSPSCVSSYDKVVFGSYLHIGKIVAASFVMDHWNELQSRLVAIFTVSGAKPGSAELQQYYEASFPEEVRQKVTYFPLWGRIAHLDFVDNLLIKFPETALRIKALISKKQEDAEALRQFRVPFGPVTVTHQSVTPLVHYVQRTVW